MFKWHILHLKLDKRVYTKASSEVEYFEKIAALMVGLFLKNMLVVSQVLAH